jgi:hypothetical protein
MDKSLSAVEAMLGRRLTVEERWMYHTTKSDPRYEYIVDPKGLLATEFKEYEPVPHLIYDRETADVRGKIAIR